MERALKIWVVISFISIVPLLLVAQNSRKDYVKAHNDARAEVGVKPLKWDPQLASHARQFVMKHMRDCLEGLSDVTFTDKYSQNIAYSAGSASGVKAVMGWLTQKTNYDPKSHSCIDGTLHCHLYTRIISAATTSLGCARVNCGNYGGTLIICFYYPG